MGRKQSDAKKKKKMFVEFCKNYVKQMLGKTK